MMFAKKIFLTRWYLPKIIFAKGRGRLCSCTSGSTLNGLFHFNFITIGPLNWTFAYLWNFKMIELHWTRFFIGPRHMWDKSVSPNHLLLEVGWWNELLKKSEFKFRNQYWIQRSINFQKMPAKKISPRNFCHNRHQSILPRFDHCPPPFDCWISLDLQDFFPDFVIIFAVNALLVKRGHG